MTMCGINWMSLWQLSLTSEMVGLEASAALLIVMMVVNIQTLGAPIAYTSIPGTISSCTSVTLIAVLGIVSNRWGKTRVSKGKILALTSFLEILGVTFVMIANGYDCIHKWNQKTLRSGHSSLEEFTPTNSTTTNGSILEYTFSGASNWDFTKERNFSYSIASILNTSSSTLPTTQASTKPFYDFYNSINGSTEGPLGERNISWSSPDRTNVLESRDKIPWNAYLVMAGYTLIDSGYDTTTCFLKTFVLDCAPQDFHASLLIKLVFTASVGGVLTSGLGASNLGEALASGTNLDPNAIICGIIAALCLILVLAGIITTTLTGLLWKPPIVVRLDQIHEEDSSVSFNSNEKIPLKNSYSSMDRKALLQESETCVPIPTNNYEVEKGMMNGHSTSSHIPASPMSNGSCGHVENGAIHHKSSKNFFQRHKKLILINILGFLISSAHFVFQTFTTNFLGEAVFRGDPTAPTGSPEYTAYLDGVGVGSQGFLISYVTSTISNVFHEKIYSWLGWKLEVFIVTFVHCVLCLVLGLTLNVWVYYACAVWFGLLRAVSISVPYILANKVVSEQGKQSGYAIVSVSAMLPLSILVCSPLIGPLIEITGNAATSIYYTSTSALLACLTALLMKV